MDTGWNKTVADAAPGYADLMANIYATSSTTEEPTTTPWPDHIPLYINHLPLVLGLAIIGQALLIYWKTNYPKNFQVVSMLGLWLFPVIRCFFFHCVVFISAWSLMTIATALLFYMPCKSRPRLIYKWFYWVYTLCSICAPLGFAILIVDAIVYGDNPSHRVVLVVGHVMWLYSLYFGVLMRDFSDYLVEKLAHRVAGNIKELYATDPDLCAVCGRHHGDAFVTGEKSLALVCGHRFHEYCLYGWALVGKKDICPFCKERVGIRRQFASGSFMQKPAYLYGFFMNFVRYLLLWYPILFLILDGLFYVLRGYVIDHTEPVPVDNEVPDLATGPANVENIEDYGNKYDALNNQNDSVLLGSDDNVDTFMNSTY